MPVRATEGPAGPAPASRLTRLVLGAVTAVAVLLAAAWALYVPLFQAADENEHFEYAVAIYAAGRPINGAERALTAAPGRTIPDPAYLEKETGFLAIVGHYEIKAPAGYGSVGYFQRLNHPAALTESTDSLLHPRLEVIHTPIGYYALAAIWLGLASVFLKGAVELFFAARFLNVLLLIPTLLLTYATARELGVSARRAVAVTGVVGLLPLTTFVFSYVQPDAFGAFLVVAATYAGLRHHREPRRLSWPAVFGLAMAVLIVTKVQYWAVVALAIGSLALVMQLRRRGTLGRRAVQAALAALPSLIAWAAQSAFFRAGPRPPTLNPSSNSGLSNYGVLHAALASGPLHTAAVVARSFGDAVGDVFFGTAARSFWGWFGWLDAPLKIGPKPIALTVAGLIGLATLLTISLALIRLGRVGGRLWRVGRRNSIASVLVVVTRNPVINGYLAFTAVVLVLETLTDTTFGAQGRYWVPFLLGFVLFVTTSVPKFIPAPRVSLAVSRAMLIALAAFAVIGSAFALPSLHQRYYGNGRDATDDLHGLTPNSLPSTYGLLLAPPAENDVRSGPLLVRKLAASAEVPAGDPLGLTGWATDPRTRLPGRAVVIVLDGETRLPAVYGDDVPSFGPNSTALIGFDALIDTTHLAAGRHTVAAQVVGRDGTLFAPGESLVFTVT